MAQIAGGASGIFMQGVQLVLAALTGALAAMYQFRTRVALMELGNKNDRLAIDERLARIERRQITTLQIVADIAKKEGVTNRFTDAVINLLANDAEIDRRPSQERSDER